MVMAEAVEILEPLVAPDPADVPNGCKHTEVGVIPTDWACLTLEEIASERPNSIVGGPFGSDLVSSHYVSVGVPVIRGQNMRHPYVGGDFVFVSDAKARSLHANTARPNDVIFTQRGTLGQVSIVPNDHYSRYIVSQSQMKLSLNNNHANAQFVYHYFSSPQGQQQIFNSAIQTGVPHTNLGILRSYKIPAPSVSEQEAICGALDDADAGIESLEQLIAKKRQIKQGVVECLISGKKRLSGFSADWSENTFGDIFDFHSTATNSRSDLSQNGELYYIHYGDIHTRFHNHLDFKAKQPPRIERDKCRNASFLRNGDWIMADASEDLDGVGKSIEIMGLGEEDRAVSGLHTFLLREKMPTFVPGFKGHLGNLRSLHEQYLRVMTGMKVFGVSKTALKDLTLNVPEPEEQTKIVEILSDMDAEIEALEGKLVKARQIKQGMMQELLTGRVRLV